MNSQVGTYIHTRVKIPRGSSFSLVIKCSRSQRRHKACAHEDILRSTKGFRALCSPTTIRNCPHLWHFSGSSHFVQSNHALSLSHLISCKSNVDQGSVIRDLLMNREQRRHYFWFMRVVIYTTQENPVFRERKREQIRLIEDRRIKKNKEDHGGFSSCWFQKFAQPTLVFWFF